jgi:MtN3 and saliva related transmembrane protein
METIDFLGYLAATFTTAAFVPQAIKVHQTKSAGDLSLPMFVMFTFGILIWFAYGLMIGSYPVILANAITFLLAGYILYHKIKYG